MHLIHPRLKMSADNTRNTDNKKSSLLDINISRGEDFDAIEDLDYPHII